MLQLEDPNDWEFGGDGKKLFDLLQTKDNFAILAIEGNAEGVNFYVF
jgi:hypothetical protein